MTQNSRNSWQDAEAAYKQYSSYNRRMQHLEQAMERAASKTAEAEKNQQWSLAAQMREHHKALKEQHEPLARRLKEARERWITKQANERNGDAL